MKSYNTLTCLFGFHQYSKELVYREGGSVHLCKICGSGYYTWQNKLYERWCEYDEKERVVYVKEKTSWGGMVEHFYDYDEKGEWVHKQRITRSVRF